jgi:exosome complex exonuclease DIS3/RRP44
MYQAQYFCSGSVSEPEYHHYGLSMAIYTHFTSPIRRYADLVVHRLLAACIGYDSSYTSDLVNMTRMQEMSDNLNYRHRNAQQASRSCVALYTNLFFKDKEVVEEGYVTRVFDKGIGVLIPKYGIESAVFMIGNVEDDLFKSEGRDYHVFQKVKVKVKGEHDAEKKTTKVVCAIVY